MTKTVLKGITWNHTRGYLPKVATAQRFAELHPDVEIVWQKRSLQDFADYSIARLAKEFDLLVIDHPSIGEAVAQGLFLPLDTHLAASFLGDQARHSVGQSHPSYCYGGHQWALAIDAATPVASWRPDLLEKHQVAIPTHWDELLDWARRGWVALPAIPIDSLMNLYMLWIDEGETPFATADAVGSEAVGVRALEALRELVSACPSENLARNPIQVYEAMTQRDDILYCPFAYGYSNYARDGYARRRLEFGGLLSRQARLRSTLGGAGLAISARTAQVESACATPNSSPARPASPGCIPTAVASRDIARRGSTSG
ncbi:extracellular solute-binding protein [Polaromonas sp. P1(28)-13]|nr:extracellular solute-binding protein [Polaromonas sp. P1(28)-13]